MSVPFWLYPSRYYKEFSNDEFFSPDPSIPSTSDINSFSDFLTIVKLCKMYGYDNDGFRFPMSVYSYYFSNIDNCKPYLEIDSSYSCFVSITDNSIKRNLSVKSICINLVDWNRRFLIQLDGISDEFIIDGFDFCMIDEIDKLRNLRKNYHKFVEIENNILKNIEILQKYEDKSEKIQKRLNELISLITVFNIRFIGVNFIIFSDKICISKDLIYPFICMFLSELEHYSGFFDEESEED